MILTLILFFTLFFAPFIITAVVKDPDERSKYMKVYAFIFIGSFFVFPIVRIIDDYLFSSNSKNTTETVADGFTIEGYEVILDVGLDNKIYVTENIDINFYESGHHGIYKFTPFWLEYTGQNNKTLKRKSQIYGYHAEGDEYTVDYVNKKERIKIGSPYQTVYGDKKYTIKYIYDMGKDPYNGFDEFIFHAFGDFWGTRIKNPKVIIHMPKSIGNNAIKVFKDKYRKDDITNLVKIEKDGNTITIDGNNVFINKSLTVDVSLPEGYFVGGSWNYGWISTTISIIIIILTLWIIISWFKYGKNHEKKIPTVEFYAPDDLSSAEIGYIYNKMQSTKKLTISLIIQLASKGYIKINEIDKDKKNSKIEIIRTYIKPKRTNIESIAIPNRSIEIEKIKDVDDNLSNEAKNMMLYMFKNSNRKILQANINKFLEVRDSLVNGGYIKIIKDNDLKNNETAKEEYLNEFKEKYEKEYEDALRLYDEELNKLPPKTALENIVYGNLFSSNDVVILSEHTSFYKTFGQIDSELSKNFKKKIHDDVARKRKIRAFIITIITLFLSLVSFFGIEDMDPAWSILYYISFACVFLNLIFSIIMGRKTEYGEYISARVKGFRDFLLTAEKEKLEALVQENHHYFYDILPYTYVLNISKKWINKFENIKMPEADMGSFHYDSDVSFHSIFDNVYYPVPTSSSSSSGCSSCGGGCSSCGGGCSSCGGGGSW